MGKRDNIKACKMASIKFKRGESHKESIVLYARTARLLMEQVVEDYYSERVQKVVVILESSLMTSRQYWSCQNGTGNVSVLRAVRSALMRKSAGEIGGFESTRIETRRYGF